MLKTHQKIYEIKVKSKQKQTQKVKFAENHKKKAQIWNPYRKGSDGGRLYESVNQTQINIKRKKKIIRKTEGMEHLEEKSMVPNLAE